MNNCLEHCGILIDKCIIQNIGSDLLDLLHGNIQQQQLLPSISGLNDNDYQNISDISYNLKNIDNICNINKVSIPPEILEHFNHIKCHCMMGLFPEIGRAWLTIDSEIYIWTYNKVRDVAYYDGLSTVIVSVGLVSPKQGVFIQDVKHLLILTTPTEIIVLGVTFNTTSISQNRSQGNSTEELQLMNKPIFCINTENVAMNVVKGNYDGRIFLGGQDGFLYEIQYQAESTWFGKRFKKINHSQGVISTIVPNFLKVFSDNDPIIKIEIDNSRNLLYILTEKSSIEVWEIGTDSSCVRRLSKIMQSDIASICSNSLKTVDLNVFKPIKSITALTLNDSLHLNLLAVSHSGVRIYMSTSYDMKYNSGTNYDQASCRPKGLYVIHVRLPPGYTPNTTFTNTPKQIHSVFYDKNCTLFMSSQQHDQDMLWSLSTAAFSNKLQLSESSSIVPLDGIVWDVAEFSSTQRSTLKSALRIEQIIKKIVLLTNQGVHILTLQKPIDILQQLLTMCGGPHNDLIRDFFRVNSPVEACLICLMLACSKQYFNTETALWAIQAFVLYGGDVGINTTNVTTNMKQIKQPIFMSTPLNTERYNLMPQDPSLNSFSNINQTNMGGMNRYNFSAKHEAMYRYVSKIVLSIWKLPCIGKNMSSSLTSNDCNELLDDLNSIKNLFEANSINDLSYIHQSELLEGTLPASMYVTNAGNMNQNNLIEQIQCEEKQSLTFLNQFIKQVCEVISLWKILNEHNFELIMASLSPNFKNVLITSSFRDLIITRTDICSNLIIAVMNSYLNDNASVSTISAKLRENCPNLYRREDAISFKATEILIASKKYTNLEEKEQQFRIALQLCKDSAPNLQLSNICQQFILAGFYEGVIDLVATCAQKFDPENIALHYYKKEESSNDNKEEYIAFNGRKEFYKEIKILLDYVYQMICNENNNTGCNILQEQSNNVKIMKLVVHAMERKDCLLHISIYEWLLEHDMISELLNISEESLGEFLRRLAINNKDNIKIIDVLWKYYEKRSQHASAANILNNLATINSDSINLHQRIEYLARAVMCMRNDNTGYSATNGALLRDYEDKLEIARVQKIMLDTLQRQPQIESTNKAIASLNSTLFSITDLYTNFAEPLEMWESKLHILNCSHHNDPLLIESIWNTILEQSINNVLNSSEKMTYLLTKVENLVKEFSDSGHCFPLSFIVRKLEIISCGNRFPKGSIPTALYKMNIDLEFLLNFYTRMLALNERIWASEGNEWHLVESAQVVVESILTNINNFSSRNKFNLLLPKLVLS
ncbi:NUP155 family protein [Megaselia abdita]